MSVTRGSAYPKYEGLLPIEPPDIVLRPIDLNPEPIDLSPQNVLIPNGQRSAWGLRLLIVFCTGVAATLVWYGDATRDITPTSRTASSAGQFNAMSFGLDAVGQNDKTITTLTTATRVDQAPAAKASGVAVESQGDAAALQPAPRLTDVKPPETLSVESQGDAAALRPAAHVTDATPLETLSEKGKPLASCFASASAVLQNHPGGWPAWTLRASGHEGTICWYAAARPGGSEHRRVGTTGNALSRSPAPRPQAWRFGLP
jgi:hypothetical protein